MTTCHCALSGRTEVLIALGLAAGAVVSLGFTRFAYALLLPPMREVLSWNFAAARGMNTAINWVIGSALATRIHTGGNPQRSALLVAIYMTGVGIGIAVSGVVVPLALELGGAGRWKLGWLVMGLLSAIAVIPGVYAVRRVPEQAAGPAGDGRLGLGALAPTFVWYVLFGAGYVAYMTFMVALLAGQGLGDRAKAVFFVILGVASALTMAVWGRVMGRLQRGWGPALVSVIVLIGVVPVLLWQGLVAAIVSGIIFGSSFMAGPVAATVIARRSLPAHGWTLGIALLTTAFSVGQAIGPLAAGLLSDTAGGITLGLWLSVALLAVAAVMAPFQGDHISNKATAGA